MAWRHRRYRRRSLQLRKTRRRPLHRSPEASQASCCLWLRLHRAGDGVVRLRHPRLSCPLRPRRRLDGSRCALACQEGPARRRCPAERLRPRLRFRALDGHARRHRRPAHWARAARSNCAFLSQGFSLDASARPHRRRDFLAARPRAAHRSPASTILPPRSASAAASFPPITRGRGSLRRGRFLAHHADSLRHANAGPRPRHGPRSNPRRRPLYAPQRFLCRLGVSQRLAERPCAQSQSGPRRRIRACRGHRAPSLQRNKFPRAARGDFCSGWSLHRHRRGARRFSLRRTGSQRATRHGLRHPRCRQRRR